MSSNNAGNNGNGVVTPLGVSYQLVVGPLLIGVVVNALVFGVCIMQLVNYFCSGYRDGWRILFLLAWVYAIDTFQVCSSVSMLWHYIVDNFSNPIALAYSPWEYATLPIFSSLAAVPIQHFMAFRIMRFSGSRVLFLCISFLSWAQAALAVTSAIQGVLNTSIESHKKIIPYADAWLALSAACDSSITAFLLYYLLKSRTGFERTDSIISTICATTVKAAVPVTLLCILDLIFLTTTPNNNLHYMFALPVGRLLTNTLMSTLNERKNLRSQMENSTPNRAIGLSALTTSKHRFQVHPAQVRINIEHDTDASTDPDPNDPNSNSINHRYPRRSSALPPSSPTSPTSPHSPHSPYSPYSPNSPHSGNMLRGHGHGHGQGHGQGIRWSRNPNSGMGLAITTDDKYNDSLDLDLDLDVARSEKSESIDVDDKASPLTESPSTEQRIVVQNLGSLRNSPVPVPVPRRRVDGDGDRQRERRSSSDEEVESEVGGVRMERIGTGTGVGYGF